MSTFRKRLTLCCNSLLECVLVFSTRRKERERSGRTDEEMLRDKLHEIKQRDPGANIHIQTDPDSKNWLKGIQTKKSV